MLFEIQNLETGYNSARVEPNSTRKKEKRKRESKKEVS
jgi:hypothetical protein